MSHSPVVYFYCGSCTQYHPGAIVARTDRQPLAEADE